MFSRNILLGFAAGVVLGALGYKFYNEHKDALSDEIKSLKNKVSGTDAAEDPVKEAEISIEELEEQKEHLEDLIAEYKAKQAE